MVFSMWHLRMCSAFLLAKSWRRSVLCICCVHHHNTNMNQAGKFSVPFSQARRESDGPFEFVLFGIHMSLQKGNDFIFVKIRIFFSEYWQPNSWKQCTVRDRTFQFPSTFSFVQVYYIIRYRKYQPCVWYLGF